MAKSIRDIPKKGRGRPPTGGRGAGVMVRLTPDQIKWLDTWIAKQREPLTRPEALRTLALMKVKTERRQSPDQQKQRAREMAGKAIDRMSDTTAPADDQAGRKRRLLKGPEEFQDSRVDRKTKK